MGLLQFVSVPCAWSADAVVVFQTKESTDKKSKVTVSFKKNVDIKRVHNSLLRDSTCALPPFALLHECCMPAVAGGVVTLALDSRPSAFVGFETHLVTFTDLKARTADAVGPGRVAFQMTLSNRHTINLDGLRDIVKAVGATEEHPLRLCFVTMKAQYEGWATATKNLPADLAAKVRLYVLWVDDESDRSV